MKIPKRFQMHGQVIEVQFNEKLNYRDDNRGLASFRRNVIELQPTSDSTPMPQTHIEQTFCHELIHYLFHHAGMAEDRDNEQKVDLLASILHQAFTTMEYE